MTAYVGIDQPIALALSGGGVRAVAFHAGVLRYLAERRGLEAVSHISSVSGGSLLIGLVFARSGMAWPSSEIYLTRTFPAVRKVLTGTNLQLRALARLLLNPLNWRYLFSRANVMAQAIRLDWGISGRLRDLPTYPQWSINGTTAETGRRFRFKAEKFGDYELGYAKAPRFRLACAMAISAAFPVGIGPLSIQSSDYTWYRRPSWNSPESEAEQVSLPYRKLHIYDGGLYDNLGLEPIFDIGLMDTKVKPTLVIVSDAGSSLTRGLNLGPLNPFRLRRLLNIVMDQTRALRVRSFVEFLKEGKLGAYLQLGSAATEKLRIYPPRFLNVAMSWLDNEKVSIAARFPTTLGRISEDEFDLIERHGYETACWNQLAFGFLPDTEDTTHDQLT